MMMKGLERKYNKLFCPCARGAESISLDLYEARPDQAYHCGYLGSMTATLDIQHATSDVDAL